jgi:hypothetical protein
MQSWAELDCTSADASGHRGEARAGWAQQDNAARATWTWIMDAWACTCTWGCALGCATWAGDRLLCVSCAWVVCAARAWAWAAGASVERRSNAYFYFYLWLCLCASANFHIAHSIYWSRRVVAAARAPARAPE